MKVADVLRSKGRVVETVQSWTPVSAAIQRLVGPPAIGALVVSDDGHGRVDGILTERDILRGLHRAGPAMTDRAVAEFMSRHVPTCTDEDTLTQVMAEMTRSRHRHMPVTDDGVLCGLISIGDVVRHRVDEMRMETDVLRDLYLARR
ncbi:CBS domain-containing protein [Pseudonocardia petroleophila]|uniref:CBS domain-containing protein n=1 Tax=Pseudonocardia petroleophila TaxID=37331 RepID=A0A7G7MIY5_9PSEU|nr:CBS domain-containing protein [Pseudonocardia petroleophila]QNG52746.1 CBS domain-containing protein [Pseudonocardia petroleophila]